MNTENTITPTTILHRIPAPENTEYHVARINRGFSVTVFDLDSEMRFPTAKIFGTEEKALRYVAEVNPVELRIENMSREQIENELQSLGETGFAWINMGGLYVKQEENSDTLFVGTVADGFEAQAQINEYFDR